MSTLFTSSATIDSTFYPCVHRLAGKRPRPDMTTPLDIASFPPSAHFKRPRTSITPTSAAISVVTPENDAPAYVVPPPPPPPSSHAHPVHPSLLTHQHHQSAHRHHQHLHEAAHVSQSLYSQPPQPLEAAHLTRSLYSQPPQPQLVNPQQHSHHAHSQHTQYPLYQTYATHSYYQPQHQASSLYHSMPTVAPSAAVLPATATDFSYTERVLTVAPTPPSPAFSQTPPQRSCTSSEAAPTALDSSERLRTDVSNSFATGNTGAIAWTNDLLVRVLASEIDELCAHNTGKTSGSRAAKFHSFFSQNRQPFELDFYMSRLVQYANCSTAAFVLMLVYVDRVQQRCKDLLLTDMNCHRIILTALLLAIKYLDDEVFSNAHYSRVGGVTSHEMNDLEVKMLNILNWELSVAPETYAMYEDGLVQSARHLLPNALPASPASPI